MSSRSPSPLERVLAEVRAQRPRVPPEAGLPPRLRAEFRSAAAEWLREPPQTARTRWRWLPALALASVAALALLVTRSGDVPAPGVSAAPLAVLDGQPLEAGALVLAAERPQRVEHPGRASWELAPGSRARLLSLTGGIVRVSLEQGSLTAEVQPSAQSETFIVQAQGTEVAVHGTRFRVSRIGDHVQVSVTAGQVQVRPIALGPATLPIPGTSLRAGMQADFWAGKTEPAPSRPVSAPAEPAVPRAAPRAATPALPRAASPPSRPAAHPAAAPAGSVEQAFQSVTEQVQSCFRQQLPGSSELGIEASTTLGLWVEPDGEVLRAQFEPPLAPAVEHCVAARLAQLRVAPSPQGFREEREIRLRR